jgi:hypothetical protein
MDPRKPWTKVSKQGYITQIHAAQPGPGVWYRSEVDEREDQHTFEFGAKDGQILMGFECYHGQARMAAWNRIKSLRSLR